MAGSKPKRICPNCGKQMKQQFFGLQHCNCGISWMTNKGFFNRTPDMVFVLETQTVKNKVKKIPAIRYKEDADVSDASNIGDDGNDGEWVVEMTKINEGAGGGFVSVSIDDYLKKHKENNPSEDYEAIPHRAGTGGES